MVFFASGGLAQKPVPGLSVTYSTGEKSAVATAQNVRLFVPEGQTPTPFLPSGKFTAVWNGFISADLRGDYSFQAELNGALKLMINGVAVLDVTGTNSVSAMSKPIRLSKGTNLFLATFTAPENGDASIRLNWKPKGSFAQPIPLNALAHFVTDEEQLGRKSLRGRELFVEHRCGKCHTGAESGMPELAMDAPSFEGIGSRRNQDWMARWIEDPKAMRASAHMPKMFDGALGKANSEAIAAYLASLKFVSKNSAKKDPEPEQAQAGKNLFTVLHCTACHDEPDASAKVDENKISLKQAGEKFAAGALVDFLKQPDLHYGWTRMPRFKLSDDQREQLAAFLTSQSSSAKPQPVTTTAMTERGKRLVQTSGCLNCHSLKLENQFATKTLAKISEWKSGCLAEKSAKNSTTPQFDFSSEDRDAMLAFAATDHSSLKRHVPSEFAERQSRNLNCIECHSKIEGVPRFEILGDKLKPEWSAKFMAGEIAYKPRPWVEAQMPAFTKRAALLAEGLAMQHGISPRTKVEPVPVADAVEAGRKLISAPPHGFSCVSCHAVGTGGAAQVFESPGINLAHSGERLLPEFFKRWIRSPTAIDPITKMPSYFDEEGNSPLTDVYEGNGEKQINAMWQYIQLGEKMPAPTME